MCAGPRCDRSPLAKAAHRQRADALPRACYEVRMSDEGSRPTALRTLGPWRQFALFQAVVWALFVTVVILPGVRFPDVHWLQVLLWLLPWTVSGVLCATLMGAVYVRLPDRQLRGRRVLATIGLTCLGAAVLWSAAQGALLPMVGREPWVPPAATWKEHLAFSTVRGFFFFSLWSGAFLVNVLSVRVQRAVEHSARAQALADEAQLQLLRSQINPHFLFNALNSVVALISENPRGAQDMVRDIATLLRKALDADARKQTSVEEELELVRLYVRCEQVRFEARLQVTFEIAPGTAGLSMPPMLLQPLVENAIKHGMGAAVDAPLLVRISARQEAGALVLEVANSGSLGQARPALLPAPSGLGLRSVAGRLGHLFPGEHRFELREQAGWVIAHVSLPLRAAGAVR